MYGVTYNQKNQGAVEAFNRTVQNTFTSGENHQK